MTPDDDSSRVQSLSRRNFTIGAGSLAVAGIAGCLGDDPTQGDIGGNRSNPDAELSVFATMPAVWDFVRQVAGDRMNAIDLVPVGEHGHDWNPDASTVEDLDTADGFVYLRDFASWQDDAADSLTADGGTVVIEASEGIEFFDSPAEDNDEHWWMDPVVCQDGVDNIAAGLAELDPEHAEEYEANAAAFNEELQELNDDFQAIVDRGEISELIVGTHDSFQWWNRRYDLDIYSPVGTSPDDAASPGDVEEIEGLIEEFDIGHVLYDVGEPARLAETLAADTGAEILPLSPVETQIDGSPAIDDSVQMEPDWGYIEHFRNINLPSVEAAIRAE